MLTWWLWSSARQQPVCCQDDWGSRPAVSVRVVNRVVQWASPTFTSISNNSLTLLAITDKWTVCKLEMWLCSNSNPTTFEPRTFSLDSKFDKCFKHLVVERKFVEKSLFYDWFRMHREPEKKLFFSQIQTITQTTVIDFVT